MNMMERVFKKRLNRIMTANAIQLGSMPKKGKIYAGFIFRRLPEQYCAKRKMLYLSDSTGKRI